MNRTRACIFKQLCLLGVAMPSFLLPLTATAANGPVTQAWVAHIEGPPSSAIEVGAMTVGPNGDVFLAGSVSLQGHEREILVSRHDAAGNLVWQRRFEPELAGGWGSTPRPSPLAAPTSTSPVPSPRRTRAGIFSR